MRNLLLAVVAVAASHAAAAQNPPAASIDVQALGPQVGSVVPPFSLPDHTGQIRTLQSIMGPRGAVLVFIRSADW